MTAPLDVNFRVGFHDKVVVVPRGGDSGSIEVAGAAEMSEEPGAVRSRLAAHGHRAAAVLLAGATVDAQTGGERFEVGAGMRFVGPEPLGRVDANETNPGGGAFRLFTAESTLDSLLGVEARLGVRVTSALHLEATGSYGSSDLKVKLSADAEDAAAITATERIGQYTVEGAAVMELTRGTWARTASRSSPREPDTCARCTKTGVSSTKDALWHAGGGVNLVLRSKPRRPASASASVYGSMPVRAFSQRGVVSDERRSSEPCLDASASAVSSPSSYGGARAACGDWPDADVVRWFFREARCRP